MSNSFSVSRFKNQVQDFLRPNTYIVKVEPPVAGADSRELSLRTPSINLPGVSFAEIDDYKIYGSGLQISVPYLATIQEISCTHTVDKEGVVLQTYYDWLNNIVDLKNDNKYSAYYYKQYVVDMAIEVYNVNGDLAKTYTLKNAYPKSFDPIELSWSANELIELSVTYQFESFEIN